MRVLQVVTHMNRGGLETMLMNYYRHMTRSKVQFDFLTHREYDGDYGQEIKSLGGRIYHLPSLNPFSIRYRMALTKFLKEHPEYKIIHVHQDCLSSIVLKVAKECGIQVRIAHSHSASQDKNLKYLIKIIYKKNISKYATTLMACGNNAGKWMFEGNAFEIINNAIDTRQFLFDKKKREEMRSMLEIGTEEMVVGHVGRFSPVKNHSFLIDIFNEVSKKIPSKLLLIGQGEIQKEIEEKVKKMGLEKYVIFAGLRTNVADFMQAMDVFVFPSLYEGLPLTLVEAQASGLPCLISDKVSDECMITDLVHQIPLSAGKIEWANSIKSVARNQRKNMYQEIVNAGFDIEEEVGKLQKFYLNQV